MHVRRAGVVEGAVLTQLATGRLGCATVIVCESFVVADWTDPGTHPGRPIAPPHIHRSDDEAWFVMSGRLGFRIG